MLRIRPMESYSDIYNNYWRYGFWYEKLGAIVLWIGNSFVILGGLLILVALIAKFF